jgi:nucleoid-associated protein YgaU
MALEKAVIANTVTGDRIPVMFNPEEYTLNKDNNFAQVGIPGLSAPLLQFVHGNLSTLEMELLVDTYEQHKEGNRVINQAGEDVRKLTRKITDLMVIDATTHAPPVLIFTPAVSLSFPGGSMHCFTCVLARVSQKMIMFLPDGTPVRARLQVTFNEFINADLEAKEVKRETVDYSSIHTVTQGETLSTIAWRVYGNPRMWRPIALRNALEAPRQLTVGQQLVVPHLPYRDPDTGEVYS